MAEEIKDSGHKIFDRILDYIGSEADEKLIKEQIRGHAADLEIKGKPEAIDHFLDIVSSKIALLKKQYELMKDKAYKNPMTDLPNENYLREVLTMYTARASRLNMPLALLALDIDGFKQVNEAYGHSAGDQILGGVGQQIKAHLNPDDFIANQATEEKGRTGVHHPHGEEFSVVLIDIPKGKVKDVAERLRQAIGRTKFSIIDNQGLSREVDITVSVGGATWENQGIDQFRRDADGKLSQAKQSGKNKVVF